MEEPSTRSRHGGRQVVAGAVIAVVGVASLVVALRGSSDATDPGSDPSPASPSSSSDPSRRDAAAIDVLAAQDRALRASQRLAYASTWLADGTAQRQATSIFANRDALGIASLHARYVGANTGGLSGSELQRLGGTAWTGDVDISWTVGGVRSRPAHSTLTYTFAVREGDVRVAKIETATGERTPVWLLGRLDVRRSPRTLVVATDAARGVRLERLLHNAVDDVQDVVPNWHGDLVGFAPSTREQFDALVDAAPHAYEGIAAVTTTVDGSRDPKAPVAIVLNPEVFSRLGPIGAQVVISHEATHAATGATTVTMPLWVAEGFADYVGVGAVDVPLRVTAGAAIRDLRKFGVPDRLPSNAAFQARDGVEATYEECWLAFRLMAARFGQSRVVDFYEDVVRRPAAVEQALQQNLGISTKQLTRDWRASLRRLAGSG